MEFYSQVGRWLVITGISLAVVGGIIWLVGRVGGLKNIPGTIRIEGNRVSCVFPLLASIVLSILLTLVLNGILRIFRR